MSWRVLQFAGVGQDFAVIEDILAMYEARGEDPPDALTEHSVYYNRGVFTAAMLVEGIRNALEATGGNQAKCADLLGINRNTLRKKITDLDIRVTRRRKLM